MDLRQAESIRAVDDDGVRRRPRRCRFSMMVVADENVEAPMIEVEHELFQNHVSRHLAVPHPRHSPRARALRMGLRRFLRWSRWCCGRSISAHRARISRKEASRTTVSFHSSTKVFTAKAFRGWEVVINDKSRKPPMAMFKVPRNRRRGESEDVRPRFRRAFSLSLSRHAETVLPRRSQTNPKSLENVSFTLQQSLRGDDYVDLARGDAGEDPFPPPCCCESATGFRQRTGQFGESVDEGSCSVAEREGVVGTSTATCLPACTADEGGAQARPSVFAEFRTVAADDPGPMGLSDLRSLST